MLKLFDFECDECGATGEYLVEPQETMPCLFCGKTMRRLLHTFGSAHRAQVNPAKTREMFGKAQEMRNKVTGKTPWRKSSHSQTGND